MKKMNKTYNAPVAEVIEMQTPLVLMVSDNDPNNSGLNLGGDPMIEDD